MDVLWHGAVCQEAQVAQLSRQNQDKGRIEDELALLQRENTEMNAELAELRLQARDFVELERYLL